MYAVATEVSAAPELYDAVHAELLRRGGGSIDGLLVHIGRVTSGGFEVIEVWESQELFERYTLDVVDPVVAEISHGQAPPASQSAKEFDLRGLIVPAAKISN